MAIGDIFYKITNTGANYTEVGIDVDPTSTSLPPIYGNGDLGNFSFDIEFYANTGVTTNDPVYDIDSISASNFLVTTSKQSNNSFSVFHSGFFEFFPNEVYEYIKFNTDGTTEITSDSILVAPFKVLEDNEYVLSWDVPTDPFALTLSTTITANTSTSPVAKNYLLDIEWSGEEALPLFYSFTGTGP